MELKKATSKDISVIQEIAKSSWTTTYSTILSKEQISYMLDLMYCEKELKNHLEEQINYHYYLLLDENKTIGFIGFEHNYELSTTKLHRIYLLKEASGKNFGKQALAFIEEQMKKVNNNRLILTVNKKNKAFEFYKKVGFEVYDEAVFDIGNGYVMDDYLMEKKS